MRTTSSFQSTRQSVSSNNFSLGRFSNGVELIVLHTMDGTVDSATQRFNNASQEVSAHYGIGEDGTKYQWVDETDTAYHCGNWDINTKSIGIEHEDDGNYNGPRSDVLYQSSAELVADICDYYNLPVDAEHIRPHHDFFATACPDALDINRIISMAADINNSVRLSRQDADNIVTLTSVGLDSVDRLMTEYRTTDQPTLKQLGFTMAETKRLMGAQETRYSQNPNI